uniref:Uncharacterized protein n=1 Tax=Arundo donax TaxID=35708 RepID=A0A0A9BPR8_ARUDO
MKGYYTLLQHIPCYIYVKDDFRLFQIAKVTMLCHICSCGVVQQSRCR